MVAVQFRHVLHPSLCIMFSALVSLRPKSVADFEAALTRAETGGADVVQAVLYGKK